MTASKPIIVERTGEIFSMASSQFRVTYPDGHVDTIWSPPWHEMGPEQEAAEAARYAARLYADGSHMRQSCPDCNGTGVVNAFGGKDSGSNTAENWPAPCPRCAPNGRPLR